MNVQPTFESLGQRDDGASSHSDRNSPTSGQTSSVNNVNSGGNRPNQGNTTGREQPRADSIRGGFAGTCHSCGKRGHRKNECPTSGNGQWRKKQTTDSLVETIKDLEARCAGANDASREMAQILQEATNDRQSDGKSAGEAAKKDRDRVREEARVASSIGSLDGFLESFGGINGTRRLKELQSTVYKSVFYYVCIIVLSIFCVAIFGPILSFLFGIGYITFFTRVMYFLVGKWGLLAIVLRSLKNIRIFILWLEPIFMIYQYPIIWYRVRSRYDERGLPPDTQHFTCYFAACLTLGIILRYSDSMFICFFALFYFTNVLIWTHLYAWADFRMETVTHRITYLPEVPDLDLSCLRGFWKKTSWARMGLCSLMPFSYSHEYLEHEVALVGELPEWTIGGDVRTTDVAHIEIKSPEMKHHFTLRSRRVWKVYLNYEGWRRKLCLGRYKGEWLKTSIHHYSATLVAEMNTPDINGIDPDVPLFNARLEQKLRACRDVNINKFTSQFDSIYKGTTKLAQLLWHDARYNWSGVPFH